MDREFIYCSSFSNLCIRRVLVSFGNSSFKVGIVVNSVQKFNIDTQFEIKPIQKILDKSPILTIKQLQLAKWISFYYFCSLGEAISLFVSFSQNLSTQKEENTIEEKQQNYITNKYNNFLIKRINLSQEQQIIFQNLVKLLNSFSISLIHGVTGSGKSYLYLKIAEFILKKETQILILVPEINLVFQIANLFNQFFNNNVIVIYHSKTSSSSTKQKIKNNIRSNSLKIIIGTRSAFFLPFSNLGAIIIDEEHENTYKNSETPRYHIRQIAQYWCKSLNIPLIFSSATPSIETYYQTTLKQKVYLFKLKNRYSSIPLPKTQVICKKNFSQEDFLEKDIFKAIFNHLQKNQQVICYLNQRGFSSFTICKECNYLPSCPDCDVSLTYHKKKNILLCHYCNFTTEFKEICENCQSSNISFIKPGTQHLENQLIKKFFGYKVFRFDSDIATTPKKMEKILQDFNDQKIQMLIGTQMIAKGHDFKTVQLVVIIDPEYYLTLPDFRSNERIFQQITQVSGRSGRAKEQGNVLIQTGIEDHFAVKEGINQDYESFFQNEINIRKNSAYPPFVKICRLVVRGNKEEKVKHAIIKLKSILSHFLLPEIAIILGPSPCLIERLKANFRWHLFIKIFNMKHFLYILNKHKSSWNSKKVIGQGVYLEIDNDPVDLF